MVGAIDVQMDCTDNSDLHTAQQRLVATNQQYRRVPAPEGGVSVETWPDPLADSYRAKIGVRKRLSNHTISDNSHSLAGVSEVHGVG